MMALSKTERPANTNKRFPKGFAKIRLRLAREPDHPEGSEAYGYDVVLPLQQTGRIASELWKSHPELCRVVHYRAGEEHELGHLIRVPGGQWKFHYDITGDEEDTRGFHFG